MEIKLNDQDMFEARMALEDTMTKLEKNQRLSSVKKIQLKLKHIQTETETKTLILIELDTR